MFFCFNLFYTVLAEHEANLYLIDAHWHEWAHSLNAEIDFISIVFVAEGGCLLHRVHNECLATFGSQN